jgi:hypothetical protein
MAPHPTSDFVEIGPDGPDIAPQGSTECGRGSGAVVSDQGLRCHFGPDGPDGPSFATFRVRARWDGE